MEALLLHLFTEYGISAGIIGVVLVALWRFEKIKTVIDFFKTKNLNLFTERDILINKLTYWMDFKIDNINIKDMGRRKIFADILKFQFETIKSKVFTIEEKPGFESMSGSELYTTVIGCLHDITTVYERKALDAGIPEIVMRKFNCWHHGSLDHMMKNVELITKSKLYKNNNDKLQAIYSLYTAMLDVTLTEAEKTLTDLNGELTGIEYKGIVCGDSH